MKLNLVNDIDKVINPGDALIVCVMKKGANKDMLVSTGIIDYYQLIICCPQCGKNSGSKGNHRYNKEIQTYHPSIIHNKKLGGCGWHGWLKNGEFIKC
jgi:hypothetical protein